ncbi:SulP family inorganic anion transporter [Sandaracinus amylolyticus]|uniref:Sulfate permease n=1 Tax=Sandaracinus amylolyticus TaxID=927083 RepID=A0A0F6W5T0_9BACT|nr:SulP family inorganic anion transporter [Sandaracinus amylolyticus]AKF07996.1 Sulfate permease [Sandaracinus amylolyticus]
MSASSNSAESSSSSTTSGRSSRPPARPSVGPHVEPPRPLSQLKHDLPASVVVFLVALPLCLGIALASGAPLLAGMITGIVGGMVVSLVSGSALAVSGPAAGLAVIVMSGIESLGSYESFLLAVVLAGAFQIGLGALRAGIIGWYFPATVIRGLLAAIGALLILKQFPHAIGLDTDYMGDESFVGSDSRNTIEEIWYAITNLRFGALIVAAIGLAILFGWERIPAAKRPKWLPAPLLVVTLGAVANFVFGAIAPGLVITAEHSVQLPTGGPGALLESLRFPDFSRIGDIAIWTTGATLAVVASIETLLSIEAIDKIDPYKRTTPTNRELVAQGLGNMIAGLIGGLPMTAVIVRGSANVQSGARTKASAFAHGALLLLAVLALPAVLNLIPLAALAAVLLHVGYKLSPVSLFRQMFRRGWSEFLPFLATFLGILLTDLLKGVAIGMAVAIFFILKRNFEMPFYITKEKHTDAGMPYVRIELSENVTFLNKAAVIKALQEIPTGAVVEIDGTRSRFIHPDVIDAIHDYRTEAKLKNVDVVLIRVPHPAGPAMGH